MRASQHNRQFARFDVDIEVQLAICDSCAEQVAPINGTRLSGRLTNISGGGAYLVLPTFLPRETLIDLDVPAVEDIPAGTVRVRVIKVTMLDREPTFGVGLRFEDETSPVVLHLQQHLVEEPDR